MNEPFVGSGNAVDFGGEVGAAVVVDVEVTADVTTNDTSVAASGLVVSAIS